MIGLLTGVNLLIAVLTLTLGISKALHARRERGWPLILTASVLIHASVIFLLATPVVYRLVGRLLHSPNVCALLVPAATLLCVAHAHALTQLWQPDKRHRAVLRRTAARWAPFYGTALIAMAVLYVRADLGPAAPLRFAAVYAHVPEVVAFHIVYWTALVVTVVVSIRECRYLSIPGRLDFAETFKKCVLAFGLALGMDLLNVALTATALLRAAAGQDDTARYALAAWLATILSCIAANVGLGWLVLHLRRAERQAYRALAPLYRLHRTGEGDGGFWGPQTLWSGWDTQLKLDRRTAAVHDGAERLSPWWSPVPALAVKLLVQADDGNDFRSSDRGEDDAIADEDLAAAQEAAILLHAAHARAKGRTELSVQSRLHALPGAAVTPAEERQHLVRVSQLLAHPLVLQAVAIADEAEATTTP